MLIKPVNAEEFFKEIWTQAALAERAARAVLERYFQIAGLSLRLRFIGTALEPYVIPALSHLEVGPASRPAALTLHCWDCASLELNFPKAPVSMEAFTPRGETRGLNDQRFHAAYDSEGRQLSLFDARSHQAAYCVGLAIGIPRFQIAEPIRAILSW